jgi:hypothetical protein
MALLTRMIGVPLRPASARPRRLRAARALRPLPLPHPAALRRAPATEDRAVSRSPAREPAEPEPARRIVEVAVPPLVTPGWAPLRTRRREEPPTPPAPAPLDMQRASPPQAPARVTEQTPASPERPRRETVRRPEGERELAAQAEHQAPASGPPSAVPTARVHAPAQLRPAVAAAAPAAPPGPVRPAPPAPTPPSQAAPAVTTALAFQRGEPAAALPELARPPAPIERQVVERPAPEPVLVPAARVAPPPPPQERIVRVRELVEPRPAQPVPVPAAAVRPAPLRAAAQPRVVPPPSPRPPVTIEIGRIEIRTAERRPPAPAPARRVRPARAHVIDPGFRFAGRRW